MVPKVNIVEDDESVSSVTPAMPAVDFEGCTFFPLESEYYEEMALRVTKMMEDAGVKAYQPVQEYDETTGKGWLAPSNSLVAF